MTGKIKKVAIKEIWGSFINPDWFLQNNNYDFEGLKNNIKENGVLRPLEVELLRWEESSSSVSFWAKGFGETYAKENFYIFDKQYKYKICNGNHRAYCLLEMYGEDYEVEVKVTGYYRDELPAKYYDG